MRRSIFALAMSVTAWAQTPVRTCGSLTSVSLPNTTIESAAAQPAANGRPEFCRVTAVLTHPPAGDKIHVWIGLPLTGWNGRFEGLGGGGFAGGNPNSIVGPVAQGYAAGSTDTGHEGASGSFALDANGRLNWILIRDNAYLGIHEIDADGEGDGGSILWARGRALVFQRLLDWWPTGAERSAALSVGLQRHSFRRARD